MYDDWPFGRIPTKQEKQDYYSRAARDKKGRLRTPHVMLHNIEHKSCSSCGNLRPIDNFRRDSSKIDKLDSLCRECRKKNEKRK